MPDKITRDYEIVHEIKERVQNIPNGEGKRIAKTQCGLTITGFTGYTAYMEGITCKRCKRTFEKEEREYNHTFGGRS